MTFPKNAPEVHSKARAAGVGGPCERAFDRRAPRAYLSLSTMAEVDACEYPDSRKVGVYTGQSAGGGLRKLFRAESTVDYYDREPR